VAWILAAWVLFGLFFASQAAVSTAHAGRAIDWRFTLAAWMTCAAVWAALTPLVLGIARRFPLERGRWRRALLVHVPASVVVSALALLLFVLAHRAWEDPARPIQPGATIRELLVIELHSNCLVYWAILGVHGIVGYHRRLVEREVAAVELSSQLAQARLEALERRLQPHFLFNTLNSISVLMHRDPAAAGRVLVRLSNLLRVVLDKRAFNEVALDEELRFLRSYLEIEQVRFQDRLSVDLEIDDETLQASVPRLLLQPLVENALQHGIAARPEEGGRVRVRARREEDTLELRIEDNGPGLHEAREATPRPGIGLSLTRARLEKLYGTAGRLELCNGRDGGVEVTVTIPFRVHG
jgi:hypothetical protein